MKGHNRKGIKLSIAIKHTSVNINDLTDTFNIETLMGNANFSGTKVKIES